jgi:hypothetical protein
MVFIGGDIEGVDLRGALILRAETPSPVLCQIERTGSRHCDIERGYDLAKGTRLRIGND